jgi:hypothetical protein
LSEEEALLLDLSGTPLEVIAHLHGLHTGDTDAANPADVTGRSALRRAMLRVRRDSERTNELFAGFGSHLL